VSMLGLLTERVLQTSRDVGDDPSLLLRSRTLRDSDIHVGHVLGRLT
jgi:hypothetical protein